MCVIGVDFNYIDVYNCLVLYWVVVCGYEMVVVTFLNYGVKSRSMC